MTDIRKLPLPRSGLFWIGFLACFAMDAVGVWLGLWTSNDPEAIRGMSLKPNWYLYPAWWVLAWGLATYTWMGFLQAWDHLIEESVLRPVAKGEDDGRPSARLVARLTTWRTVAIVAVIPIAVILVAIDTGCLMRAYDDGLASMPPFSWGASNCQGEDDFFVAFTKQMAFGIQDPNFRIKNAWFAVFAYFLEGALIALAFLSLFQLCIHQIAFATAARPRFADRTGMKLALDIRDPLREFGLMAWNRALNYTYALIAAAMLIPIVSHASQTGTEARIGQLMLQVFLPLLFLAPIVLAVWGRQLHVDRLKVALAAQLRNGTGDEETEEQFHNQKLWPFDRDLIGRTAFTVILVEYAFVASNAPDVIRGFLGGG